MGLSKGLLSTGLYTRWVVYRLLLHYILFLIWCHEENQQSNCDQGARTHWGRAASPNFNFTFHPWVAGMRLHCCLYFRQCLISCWCFQLAQYMCAVPSIASHTPHWRAVCVPFFSFWSIWPTLMKYSMDFMQWDATITSPFYTPCS